MFGLDVFFWHLTVVQNNVFIREAMSYDLSEENYFTYYGNGVIDGVYATKYSEK